MNANNLARHLAISQLAMALHQARNAAQHAKHAYYAVLSAYQQAQGEPGIRLDPGNEACAEIIAVSAADYKAYQAAKRKVYNAQRRLDTACRKGVKQ